MKSFSGEKVSVVAPCCNMIGFKNTFDYYKKDQKDTFEEYFYSEPMEKLREQLLTGRKPSCCDICWRAEAQGITSHRLYSENTLPDDHTVKINDPKLVTIDVSTGNKCNLRCRMCQPGSSDKLNLDYVEMSKYDLFSVQWNNTKIRDTTPKNSLAWNNFLKDQGSVTSVKVMGGEPFITDEFIDLLNSYIKTGNAKNTALSITTNGTKFNNKTMDLLNQFKFINIVLSVDSTEKNYEYIRYPMPWKKLTKSVDTFFEKITTHFNICINTPIMIYNVHTMSKLCKWAEEKNIDHVYCNNVHPIGRGIDIRYLPANLIKMYYDEVKKYHDTKYFRGPGADYFRHMIKNSVENKRKATQEIKIFDRIRNQNYKDFLDKEIVRWLNEK